VALQSQGLQLERRIGRIGSRQVLINAVRLDPRQVPLELRPLNRSDGMQGLSSLSQLARQEQALIAINGGYFNRVNRLPLGAMREQGRWLSGPILNRGAAGWKAGELPRFDRLMLVETIEDSNRQRWTVTSVNSGYVQKGLARYTADWGSRYQPITGSNPPRFRTGLSDWAERVWQGMLDSAKAAHASIRAAACTDINGFLPTHISAMSQRPTGDLAHDTKYCRNGRILFDPVDKKAKASTAPYMMAVYRQEGDGQTYYVVRNVYVPLVIGGRRWGDFELAYSFD